MKGGKKYDFSHFKMPPSVVGLIPIPWKNINKRETKAWILDKQPNQNTFQIRMEGVGHNQQLKGLDRIQHNHQLGASNLPDQRTRVDEHNQFHNIIPVTVDPHINQSHDGRGTKDSPKRNSKQKIQIQKLVSGNFQPDLTHVMSNLSNKKVVRKWNVNLMDQESDSKQFLISQVLSAQQSQGNNSKNQKITNNYTKSQSKEVIDSPPHPTRKLKMMVYSDKKNYEKEVERQKSRQHIQSQKIIISEEVIQTLDEHNREDANKPGVRFVNSNKVYHTNHENKSRMSPIPELSDQHQRSIKSSLIDDSKNYRDKKSTLSHHSIFNDKSGSVRAMEQSESIKQTVSETVRKIHQKIGNEEEGRRFLKRQRVTVESYIPESREQQTSSRLFKEVIEQKTIIQPGHQQRTRITRIRKSEIHPEQYSETHQAPSLYTREASSHRAIQSPNNSDMKEHHRSPRNQYQQHQDSKRITQTTEHSPRTYQHTYSPRHTYQHDHHHHQSSQNLVRVAKKGINMDEYEVVRVDDNGRKVYRKKKDLEIWKEYDLHGSYSRLTDNDRDRISSSRSRLNDRQAGHSQLSHRRESGSNRVLSEQHHLQIYSPVGSKNEERRNDKQLQRQRQRERSMQRQRQRERQRERERERQRQRQRQIEIERERERQKQKERQRQRQRQRERVYKEERQVHRRVQIHNTQPVIYHTEIKKSEYYQTGQIKSDPRIIPAYRNGIPPVSPSSYKHIHRNTSESHIGNDKFMNASQSNISKISNLHFLVSHDAKYLVPELKNIAKGYDQIDVYKTTAELQNIIEKANSNFKVYYDIGLVFYSNRPFDKQAVADVDTKGKYYTVDIDKSLRKYEASKRKREIRVPNLAVIDSLRNQLLAIESEDSDAWKFSSFIFYKDRIKSLERIAQLFPSHLYHTDKFMSSSQLVKILDEKISKKANAKVIILSDEVDFDQLCHSTEKHESFYKNDYYMVCYNSGSMTGSLFQRNIQNPRIVMLLQAEFRNYQQFLTKIELHKNDLPLQYQPSASISLQRQSNYDFKNTKTIPSIPNLKAKERLFFHKALQTYRKMVEEVYAKFYRIEEYEYIGEVEGMVQRDSGFKKNILFMHSSLQDQKVNLELFDYEVYMLGNTQSLQNGVITISGPTQLIDLLKKY